MTDCKNCKYTDEYCASGDCNRIQANNLACNKISSTEQFDNDKITKGSYYCKSKLDGHICIAGFISYKGLFDCNYNGTLNKGYWEVLAPVPSYEEWQEKDNALTSLLVEYGKLTKELQDEKEKHMTHYSLCSPADKMVIEKQVWESTLHRSMVLQAENEQLKEAMKDCQEKILLMDYDSIKIEILQKIDEALK